MTKLVGGPLDGSEVEVEPSYSIPLVPCGEVEQIKFTAGTVEDWFPERIVYYPTLDQKYAFWSKRRRERYDRSSMRRKDLAVMP